MISEPELSSPYADPDRAYRRPEEVPDLPPGPPPGLRGVRVRWALGGALVSAALAAGVLAVTGVGREDRPDLSYVLPHDMCERLTVPALERVSQTRKWSAGSRTDEDPALASGLCTRDKEIADRRRPWRSWTVETRLELHRRVDPATEFRARAVTARGLEHVTEEAVSGLGQQAVMLSSPAMEGRILRVLDGGAVFELSVLTSTTGEAPFLFSPDPADLPEPDWTAVQAAMIEDMQGMLAATHEK
ncbi:hypothetical protein [Streptomyces sp. NPDC089919]|uniref:hypothetical protein n=1 Tax=Streptomyces sp. NPDC089919 TaxID=3155188 RepID=UPI00341A071C